jgi:hypothetical protein
MTASGFPAMEGKMRSRQRRWTIAIIAIWVITLGLSLSLAPTPAEATAEKLGWMVYTPNHPDACAPLPYDCYVIRVWGAG